MLSRTPEVRIVALVVVIPIAVPEASKQRRKREIIRTVTTVIPT